MHTKQKRTKKLTKKREKIKVLLSDADIAYLKRIVKRGTHPAQVINRSRILLMSHDGKTNRAIVDALACSPRSVTDVRERFIARGKDVRATIHDAPRSGQPRKILPEHETFVVATCCTDPPEGHAHWTLDALRKRLLNEYEEIRTVSDERIRHILLANKLKPWREKNVVRAQAHAALS
jgi:transposase